MKVLTLARAYLSDRTIGRLHGFGIDMCTLELPWKSNKVDVSCIPEGAYRVQRDRTGKHQAYKVTDVKGRTGIEFHVGNYKEDTQGCILVGTQMGGYGNVHYSKAAIGLLIEHMGDEDFLLYVTCGDKDTFQ